MFLCVCVFFYIFWYVLDTGEEMGSTVKMVISKIEEAVNLYRVAKYCNFWTFLEL